MTVVVPERRLTKPAREAGGGVDGRARVLAGLAGEVEAQLRGSLAARDVAWLTSPELAAVCRTGFAPADRAGLIAADAAHAADPRVCAGVPWAHAGPAVAHSRARSYPHDGWRSVSITLHLPADGAGLGALAPLLVPSGVGERRSLLVAYPILPAGVADRSTATAEWAADLGEELRARARVRPRARHRRTAATTRAVDARLAGGGALLRPYAVATVTAPADADIGEHAPAARRRRPPGRVRAAAARPGPRPRLRRVGAAARPHPRRPDPTMTHADHPARGPAGRGVARLLADFDHPVPAREPAATAGREPALFTAAPRRGPAGRGRGWAGVSAPVSVWSMTSDQAPVLWPFIATPGLPPTGALMGIDLLSGGAFYADPHGWVVDEQIPVTNPNVFIFGKPGRGKSAVVKPFLLRMLGFGYRALIVGDPKDEYAPLCRVLGVEPFRIGPGLPARINPLDPGPLAHRWADLSRADAVGRAAVLFGRWLTLVRGLVGSQRIGETRVPFGPSDDTVVRAALAALTGYTGGATRLAPVTVPDLWRLLDQPTPALITDCRYEDRRRVPGRHPAAAGLVGPARVGHPGRAVRRPHHHHRGLAGADPIPVACPDWTALGDEAVGIALLCLNSWGRGMRDLARPGDRRIVVRDESWKQLRLGVEAVKSFDADLRLSRAAGDIQIAVGHKPSDPLSAGDAGSQAVAIAKDLLHLADIKILLGQDPPVAAELDHLLGLGPIAQQLVCGWAMHGRGRALWCVGDRLYQVRTLLHPAELALTDTNHALHPAGVDPDPDRAVAKLIAALLAAARRGHRWPRRCGVAVVVAAIPHPDTCAQGLPAAAAAPAAAVVGVVVGGGGGRRSPGRTCCRRRTGAGSTRSSGGGSCTPARTWSRSPAPPRSSPPRRAASASPGTQPAWGVTVVIDHGGGIATRYAHLHHLHPGLRTGQSVGAGQPLGVEGSTGASTGNHLHFEVTVAGRPVDPIRLHGRPPAPPSTAGRHPPPRPGSRRTWPPGWPRPNPSRRGWGCRAAGLPRRFSLHQPPLPIPGRVRRLYEAAGRRFGVPWTLLAGIGMEETGHGRTHATSHRRRPRADAVPAGHVRGDGRRRRRRRPGRHRQRRRQRPLRRPLPGRIRRPIRPGRRPVGPVRVQPGHLVRQRRPALRPRLRRRHHPHHQHRRRPDLRRPRPTLHVVVRVSAGGVARVLAWADAQTHLPYRFGGTGPDGYDCSGYTQAAYRRAGLQLPADRGGATGLARRRPRHPHPLRPGTTRGPAVLGLLPRPRPDRPRRPRRRPVDQDQSRSAEPRRRDRPLHLPARPHPPPLRNLAPPPRPPAPRPSAPRSRSVTGDRAVRCFRGHSPPVAWWPGRPCSGSVSVTEVLVLTGGGLAAWVIVRRWGRAGSAASRAAAKPNGSSDASGCGVTGPSSDPTCTRRATVCPRCGRPRPGEGAEVRRGFNPTAVGWRLGTGHAPRGGQLWVPWDRTCGVLGLQGSGKTLDLLIPALLAARGPDNCLGGWTVVRREAPG